MLKSLIKISKNNLLLPFYHLVSNDTPTFVKHLYQPKTINQFKEDLSVFLNYYQPISLAELILVNQGKKKLTKPSFHLTFDDGLSNFYEIVAPILLEKKIPATIFLNTDFVDNKALFYRYKASLLIENYLTSNETIRDKYRVFVEKKQEERRKRQEARVKRQEVKEFLLSVNFDQKELLDELANQVNYTFSNFLESEKPYLTLAQIKDLQTKGLTFGAHSTNHPLYADLSLNEQLKQTKDSLNWLKKELDIKHRSFSFPFYDMGVSKQFFNDITSDLDISFGTSGIKKDKIKFHLQRLDMEKSGNNTKTFIKKTYLKYLLKSTTKRK